MAFSVAGYVFVFDQESQWGTKGNDGKFKLYTSDDKYLFGHELIHQIQSEAWGVPSNFLAEYNRQYNSNWLANSGEKDIYTRLLKSYVNVSFEIDAYTFGPSYSASKTKYINPATGKKNYIRW